MCWPVLSMFLLYEQIDREPDTLKFPVDKIEENLILSPTGIEDAVAYEKVLKKHNAIL